MAEDTKNADRQLSSLAEEELLRRKNLLIPSKEEEYYEGLRAQNQTIEETKLKKESRFIVMYNNTDSAESDVLARSLSHKEKALIEQFCRWAQLDDFEIEFTFKEIEEE